QAGGTEAVHQLDALGDTDRGGLVLQAIARSDFHQAHLPGQGHGLDSCTTGHGHSIIAAGKSPPAGSSSSSRLPSVTMSPSPKNNGRTVPLRSARTLCSSFIASSTISAVPAPTCWPGCTSTRTTLPFMGALRPPSGRAWLPAAASGSWRRTL